MPLTSKALVTTLMSAAILFGAGQAETLEQEKPSGLSGIAGAVAALGSQSISASGADGGAEVAGAAGAGAGQESPRTAGAASVEVAGAAGAGAESLVATPGEPFSVTFTPDEPVSLAYPPARIDVYQESLLFEGDSRTYTVAPSTSGNFCVQVSEMMAGLKVNVVVSDHLGNTLYRSTTGLSNDYAVFELQAGEVYTVEVAQYKGTGDVTVGIGYQRDMFALYTEQPEGSGSIVAVDVACDAVRFPWQTNRYVFTAQQAGTYRFELAEMMSGDKVNVAVHDHLGRRVKASSTGMGTGEGLTVQLEEGETYTVSVTQCEGLGTYELHVGYQRPALRLDKVAGIEQATGFVLHDQTGFTDQVVEYYFVAPCDGTYVLGLGDMMEGFKVNLAVHDHLLSKVRATGSGMCNDEMSVELKAGETYRVSVSQYEGLGPYTLTVSW